MVIHSSAPTGSAASQAPDDPIPFEERQERRRRRFLIFGLPLIAILLVGLGFATPPTVRAIKGWQSRRLAREAFALLDRAQWPEAFVKAQDAYVVRPTEPESWRAVATLLTRTGQPNAALPWWRNVAAAHRLTPEDRRAYAAAALAAGTLPDATAQVDWLLARGGPLDPGDALLASQLASRQRNPSRAADYARRALTDGRSQPQQQMVAILQVFAVTGQDSPLYAAAWTQMLRLAGDPANPVSLDALRLLADPKLLAPTRVAPLFPAAEPAGTSASPTLDEIAVAIDAHPAARPEDHLLAWELRVRAHPEAADALLEEGVQRFGHGDDAALAGLARFLNARHRAATTLELLSAERARQTRELALAYLDALAETGRWGDLKSVLTAEQLPIDALARHVYLAVVSSKLGEPGRTAGEWEKAVGSAGKDAAKLLAVGSYAETWHADDVADAAYAAAIEAAPTSRDAYEAREKLATARGDTKLLCAILTQVARFWPEDQEAAAAVAYLDLLLGGADADTAAHAATPLALAQPANWAARATLALARLRGGQPTSAMAAFSGDRGTMDPHARPGDSVPPGAQAVWVATLAANGWKIEAAAAAQRLVTRPLLPEERALIKQFVPPSDS